VDNLKPTYCRLDFIYGIGISSFPVVGDRSLFMALGALIGLGLSYYLIFAGLAREIRPVGRAKQAQDLKAKGIFNGIRHFRSQ